MKSILETLERELKSNNKKLNSLKDNLHNKENNGASAEEIQKYKDAIKFQEGRIDMLDDLIIWHS